MKKIILILLISVNSVFGQFLSFYNIDNSKFPLMKAKLDLFDSDYKQILNLNSSDFELKENGILRKINLISCPEEPLPVQISSVLTIDVSASMLGNGIIMAKQASNIWLNNLELGPNECAITSFDNLSYLNQDFTINKNQLQNAVNALVPKGGTNYEAGFNQPLLGALDIASKGKHKKVIVFLSDGVPNFEPNSQEIIDKAALNNIVIFAVTLNISCPQSLKDISTQTGGKWFEGVTTSEQVKAVYSKILQIVKNGKPCEFEWNSEKLCEPDYKNIEIKYLNDGNVAKNGFQVPVDLINKLEFSPPYISFKNAEPGIKKDFKVIVKAINFDFKITDILCSDDSFSIEPKSFELNEGNSLEITVSVIPPDSGYIFTEFNFINELCITKYYANAGYVGKTPKVKTLKLIQPNGGEVLVAGFDTVITWEGILPNEKVKIEYTTDEGTNWKIITDTASGLQYNWKIPATPGNYCLARVTTNLGYDIAEEDMVLIPAGKFIMGQTGHYKGTDNIHEVTITKPFFMSKYEVTQQKWKKIMENNPSSQINEKFPVHNVNWIDAVDYCNKLSEKAGLQPCYIVSGNDYSFNINANGYRLPTEAEWEYACKAGSTTDYYSGGNMSFSDCSPVEPSLKDIAWYCGNSGNSMHKVGEKLPTKFGVYDMSGSIWEWCWDWYDAYPLISVSDPLGPLAGTARILRGCSWLGDAYGSQSATRYFLGPLTKNEYLGFRICRNL